MFRFIEAISNIDMVKLLSGFKNALFMIDD